MSRLSVDEERAAAQAGQAGGTTNHRERCRPDTSSQAEKKPKSEYNGLSGANGTSSRPVLIIGAGISGLLLAQHLKQRGVPYRIFERDLDPDYRGLGWGLTLHWSLPALRKLLGEELFARMPESYVNRLAVERGECSRFPFYDLATGELIAAVPDATEADRVRVTRARFRKLLGEGVDVEVGALDAKGNLFHVEAKLICSLPVGKVPAKLRINE